MKKIGRLRRFEKPLLAVAAVLVVLACMLGGTFAWRDFSQTKTNKFRGFADADVTLHDEFDGVNKDVFVENSGTSPVYARIRLDEYMEVGGAGFAPLADVRNKTTWMPHTYDGAAVEDCGHTDAYHLFHDYYVWELSGAARTYLEGTPGLVYSALGSDGLVDPSPVDGLPTAAAAAPVTMTAFFDLKAMVDGAAAMSPAETAAWTAATTTGCWILDDTVGGDGWAYWSVPLLPGTATNLLLDSVAPGAHEPADDWFYGIDVKLQAVTESDFGRWSADGFTVSANALLLIDMWQTGT